MKLKQLSNQKETIKSVSIMELNANITTVLNEILRIQVQSIKIKNIREVKELLERTDILITECHTASIFKTARNEKFNRLVYEYQRLNLKYEAHNINEQIREVNRKYKEIESNQEQIKNESNNLVYNILGFIASFSIVSAGVAAISNLTSMTEILLFMSFCILLLLTTLIGLHNFYKSSNGKKIRLQNNYFLWKMILGVVVLLVMYKCIIYVKENRNEILEIIGREIGQTISMSLNEE